MVVERAMGVEADLAYPVLTPQPLAALVPLHPKRVREGPVVTHHRDGVLPGVRVRDRVRVRVRIRVRVS